MPEESTPTTEVSTIAPPALPAPGELTRPGKARQSLTDLVEPVFADLYATSPRFVQYLSALSKNDAVEGNIKDDDTVAALMIRDAVADGHPIKIVPVSKLRMALGNVMGRYEIRRTQRQRVYQTAIAAANPSN